MHEGTWKKSSKCAADSPQCVEVFRRGALYSVRQSIDPGTVLQFTASEWDAFIAGAKAGEFDAGSSFARVHASNV
jgi:hypothetical protein